MLLLRRFWWAVPIFGLAAALVITRGTLAEVKRERDGAGLKLEVTAASLKRLSAEMNRVMAGQRALSIGDTRRIAASRGRLRLAEATARARLATIDRLNTSAAVRRAAADCAVSDTVREVWK